MIHQLRFYEIFEHNKTAFADRKPEPPAKGQAGYLGVEACTECHDETDAYPVLAMFKTRHAVVGDSRTPFANDGCAACHVLFTIANKMKINEQDAADMLSEVLLDNNQLNDQFIEMVENIHMKQRTMGLTFVLKSREAKGRRIESQFKNTLNELLGDASHYGS